MATQDGDHDMASTPQLHGALDWDHDPRNARNWPARRKLASTATVSAIGFVSTLAASIYAPGHDDAAGDLHTSATAALLPLSVYNLGMAFGPVLASPVSETLGRRAVYLATTPLFAVFVLASGFCAGLPGLVVCRFFAGLFGAPGVSIASATIADTTPPPKRGTPLAIYYSIPFVGSLLGPLIGSLVVSAKGWRWTMWTTLFFAAAVFPSLLFLRESYRRTIMQRIARREGLELEQPQRDSSKVIRYFFTTTVARPVHMLFSEPIVALVCLYCGFQFALLYTFVIASPYVFSVVYGFTLPQQGLSFVGFIVGALFGTMALVVADQLVYQRKYEAFIRLSSARMEFPPEHRLYGSLFGSVVLPVGLFLFAWTARPSVHWIVPIIAQAVTMIGSIMVYVGANMYMLDTYGPLYGASAAGSNSLARYTLSAAFPLFTTQTYTALGIDWATSLLGFCTVAMAPIPWVFFRFGPMLRKRSRYEREL